MKNKLALKTSQLTELALIDGGNRFDSLTMALDVLKSAAKHNGLDEGLLKAAFKSAIADHFGSDFDLILEAAKCQKAMNEAVTVERCTVIVG